MYIYTYTYIYAYIHVCVNLCISSLSMEKACAGACGRRYLESRHFFQSLYQRIASGLTHVIVGQQQLL